MNQHHIFTSSRAGIESPTVPLCTDCHDTLHAMASKVLKGKEVYWPYCRHSTEGEIANKLVVPIVSAMSKESHEVKLAFAISKAHHKMLNRIKEATGCNSQRLTVEFLIEFTANKLIK